MASHPGAIEEKINAVTAGWTENASGATFGNLTVAQFKLTVKPSVDARATIADLELQLAAARVARDNADVATLAAILNVVSSVKGDPHYGENSALYSSFGYVRKSERKSGLTRGTQPAQQPAEPKVSPVELKVAA